MKGRKAADRENEIKLAVRDAAWGRRLLRAAGFRVLHPRSFEVNLVYDTPDRRLLGARSLLRVREVKRRGTLTYKGPPDPGPHKTRVEIESNVEAEAARQILQRVGFVPAFRYEKFRTELQRPGERGVATLDETPIGVYFELEGSPRWVDRTARGLGFTRSDYITASYGTLYREWCARLGVEPGDMVFPAKTATS